jgi:hypothetical protein
MSPELFAALFAAVLLGAWLVRRHQERLRRGGPPPEPAAEDESLLDLNEKFFRVAAGRPLRALVRSYAPADTNLLRSVLDAEGIPSHCAANSLGSLYGGVSFAGFSDELIEVLAEDWNDARAILADILRDLAATGSPARPQPEFCDED